MKLLYPEFLYALGFLLIPILIHLFNFRRYKLVNFSQVRFLKEVQKQTRSTSRLKHLLVLISRCVAITALVLAFCQPFIPIDNQGINQGAKGVSIYIDNSFSMQAKAESGQLLDIAKNRAISIISAFKTSDKFQILTNDFEGKHQRWLNKEAFIQELQEVDVSPIFRTSSEIINRQEALFEESQLVPKRFFISDLQKSSFDIGSLKDSITINLVPLKAESTSNLVIDSLQFTKPYQSKGLKEELKYRIRNHSKKDKENVPVQLSLNGQLKSPMQVKVKTDETHESSIAFKSGTARWQKGVLSLKDYPVNFDDSLYFSYEIKENVKLLHLYQNEQHSSLKKLFTADSFIVYQTQSVSQVNFNQFGSFDMIALDEIISLSSGIQQELKKFVDQGGTLTIFPSDKMKLNDFNSLLVKLGVDQFQNWKSEQIKVSELNSNSSIYEDVFEELPQQLDLPTVNNYWTMSNRSQSNREVLLSLQNNNPFLSKYSLDRGKVYLAASGLQAEYSNFTSHAIFVPTLYNMALQSRATAPIFHFLNQQNIRLAGVEAKESPVRLISSGIDFIPAQRFDGDELVLNINNKLKKSGHYNLLQGVDTLGIISLNYSREESDLSRYDPAELKNIADKSKVTLDIYEAENEGLISLINNREEGKSLWKYFIILALVFLGFEITLLRLFK